MAVNNNLYPPIVDTYAPSFIIKEDEISVCKIPINFSSFNSSSDINTNAIQVIVSYQSTNKNALNTDTYPSQIMLKTLQSDGTIIIDGHDLQDGDFKINTYYKIQIRFTKSTVVKPSTNAIDSWLAENLENFSEWSTVILARGISYSGIVLTNFPTDSTVVLNSTSVRIAGKLEFEDEQETDFLSSYNIKVFDAADIENETPIYQTGELYNEGGDLGKNEINYLLKYAFRNSADYNMYIEYTTQTGYQHTSALYNFTIIIDSETTEITPIDIAVSADNEDGRMKILLTKPTPSDYDITNQIVILRSSSKENFTIWEDVFYGEVIETVGTTLNYTWYDYTAESGVWYSYGIQTIVEDNKRTLMAPLERNMTMLEPEYTYLVANNKQFKIKFNTNISSFKHNISESKTDTIGSKYPFIKRNGYVNYKTFPISGTISYLTDEENLMASTATIYKDLANNYAEYNQDNHINTYNDYIYEKAFRDVIINFLYENNVKLFKSKTEGNILVKLMDITFTPNQTLGNYIYDFSCSAHEIDECSIANYDKYNIQNLRRDNPQEEEEALRTITSYGEYADTIAADTNLLDVLTTQQRNRSLDGEAAEISHLNYVKINIESDPYLIIDIDGVPTIATQESDPNEVYTGYIAYINGKPFVIGTEGIYILQGDDITITSLTFAKESEVIIQYNAIINITKRRQSLIDRVSYFSRVGQLSGVFDFEDSLYTKIWNHYYLDIEGEYRQGLVSINSMDLDVEPGAVFYLQTSESSTMLRYVVGETGVLSFYDEDYVIQEAWFAGKHFDEATAEEAQRETLPETKFVNSGITLAENYTTENLKANYIYIINNEQYIWYNQQMYKIDVSGDIQCPVEGLVDYTCDIAKGYYA